MMGPISSYYMQNWIHSLTPLCTTNCLWTTPRYGFLCMEWCDQKELFLCRVFLVVLQMSVRDLDKISRKKGGVFSALLTFTFNTSPPTPTNLACLMLTGELIERNHSEEVSWLQETKREVDGRKHPSSVFLPSFLMPDGNLIC